MSNELKDIAMRLNGYGDDGWQIESASKRADGGWDLIIQPLEKEETEAQDDNN